MRIPVVFYVCAILAMGIAASGLVQLMVIVGALMFMLSDIILSHELFVWKEGSARTSVFSLFHMGILLGRAGNDCLGLFNIIFPPSPPVGRPFTGLHIAS